MNQAGKTGKQLPRLHLKTTLYCIFSIITSVGVQEPSTLYDFLSLFFLAENFLVRYGKQNFQILPIFKAFGHTSWLHHWYPKHWCENRQFKIIGWCKRNFFGYNTISAFTINSITFFRIFLICYSKMMLKTS